MSFATHFIRSLAVLMVVLSGFPGIGSAARPDVLFIVIDDLNDWIRLLDEDAPIRTPNLERLAARGVLFKRAYSASPACNPSRVAVLTGLRPSTTGVYGNKTDWRRALPDAVTLPRHFMNHGYRVEGAGKLFHHHDAGAFHDADSFHQFQSMPDPPDAPMPAVKLNRLKWYGSPNTDWGPWPRRETEHVDVRTVNFCVERLKAERDRPLFLACGIFRPHMPFFAPEAWFDAYPLEGLTLPELKEGDTDDIPSGGQALLKRKAWFWRGMLRAEEETPGAWREAVRAYQACAGFADAQVGRLLDALDDSGRAASTVIVLWSDHGYHLGEKTHWEKFALWEKATHVPFLIAAPGVAAPGSVCESPVDLMAVYPTLIELCGLTSKPELDGVSLVPLLRKPDMNWPHPALMTYLRDNHAVRTTRWRYIRYADGSEELYDHAADPNEWSNLASDPGRTAIKARLRQWLPKDSAPPAPDLKRR